MEPKEFCLWLKGFLEANENISELSSTEVDKIRKNLQTVLIKITPTNLKFSSPKEKAYNDPYFSSIISERIC